MISIKIKSKDNKVVIFLQGEINIHQVPQIQTQLIDIIDQYDKIAINLEDVTELDSAGFQFLISLKQNTENQNKVFKLINHSIAVLKVFSVYGAVGLFKDKIKVPSGEEIPFDYGTEPSKVQSQGLSK